jgi:hypothetical protein
VSMPWGPSVVTSRSVRSAIRNAVPFLLCLILILGGLCNGLCLAQTAVGGSQHACCHEKDHCGHAAPSMQSHQAVASFQAAPVVLTQPLLLASPQFSVVYRVNAAFVPSVVPITMPPVVLRL